MTSIPRPDPEAILSGLKDFQRDTVDYVFRRLYTDSDATRRFLIADEVGLGKTVIARGLIAKAADHLWERVPRVDVIYICSNADIARQNINRLNITGQSDFSFASRITLLPITLRTLNANRINFVSFTPGTSFDMGNSLGIARERALLYWMLVDAWGLDESQIAPLYIFQGNSGFDGFRSYVRWFKGGEYAGVDETVVGAYRSALAANDGARRLRERFGALCERFQHVKDKPNWQDRYDRNRFIGDLRELLAETCLAELQPDLIILDEFQRFKHLLEHNANDEVSQLAHRLFTHTDKRAGEEGADRNDARVVLLSATPYKMYTLAHDQEQGDDHYQDFLRTVRFLQPEGGAEFERLITAYRREILRLGKGEASRIREIKAELEQCLRRVMVRTERLSAGQQRSGMLKEVCGKNMQLTAAELRGYLHSQRIARALKQPDIMEYWKSAPYLFNYMEDYQLKGEFQKAVQQPERAKVIAGELADNTAMLLPWEDIVAYRRVDPNNARLRSLLADTTETGAWRLLWVPPSLRYYGLEGPYADPQLAHFTKRLVFSSWKIVPKVIATMVSYEAERQLMLSLDSAAQNTQEARERRRGLLLLNRAEGRPAGMPVLGLMYPCLTLANDCDPLVIASELRQQGLPTLDEVRSRIGRKIATRLTPITRDYVQARPEDHAWYWAAPILLA